MQTRTSLQVTASVYYALFMRELYTRLFKVRFAWLWLFLEPILFVVIMVGLRTFIQILDRVAGAEMIPWMIIGLSAFFMFRDGMNSGMEAIRASQGLFAYRQLKPIDTVVVRIFTLGVIHLAVFMLLVVGLLLLGFDLKPAQLLLVLIAWLGLWLLGLGLGLILSVFTHFVPEVSRIVSVISLPLMILSGAFLPLHYMPYDIQQILLWNPVLHLIEWMRLGMFEGYWTLDGVTMLYPLTWTLGALFFGMSLHLHFESRLKIK